MPSLGVMAGDLFSKLEGVQALVFDAYGTLFDVASPVMKQTHVFGEKTIAVAKLWRAKQLEYAWVRSLVGTHADFFQVSRDALVFTLEALQLNEQGLADEMMSDMLKLEAFPEALAALQALRSRGKRLAILSNGSPSMLYSAVQSAGMDKMFEHVISVEDVGIYKPSRRAYRLAMQKFGIQDAPSICFISANGWDAHSAAQFGFQAVRLKRNEEPDERLPGKVTATIRNLEQISELV